MPKPPTHPALREIARAIARQLYREHHQDQREARSEEGGSMDTKAILAKIIDPDVFDTWPVERRKHAVEDLVAEILDSIENLGREPDGWEQQTLSTALTCVRIGAYRGGLNEVADALRSVDKRSSATLPGPLRTLKDLRAELALTIKSPARRRP